MVSRARRRCPIALLSDFGYRDHYTGVMKGVIASIAPDAPVVDLTHGIPAQSVAAGGIVRGRGWRVFFQKKRFFALGGPRGWTHLLPIQLAGRPCPPLVS